MIKTEMVVCDNATRFNEAMNNTLEEMQNDRHTIHEIQYNFGVDVDVNWHSALIIYGEEEEEADTT